LNKAASELKFSIRPIECIFKDNGINLKRHKKKYTNLNTIALNTINDYVYQPNQVIRMVVLGHIVSKCLRERPSNRDNMLF